MRSLAFSLLSLMAWFLAPPALALEEEAGRIAIVEAAMKRAGVKGAVVVLLDKGEVTWARPFGTRGAGRGLVTLDTEFEAASNGKMLTAYMIMQLIEEGRYTLETPLSDPRLKIEAGCKAPTVGQALSHTAGLGNNLQTDVFNPACNPGETFSYAGEGYMVLQEMVDTVASGTIEDVMMKRVFVPLNMKSASFTPQDRERFAAGNADLVFGLISGRAPSNMKTIGWALFGFFGLCLITTWVIAYRRHSLLVAIPVSFLAAPFWGALATFALSQLTTPISRHLGEPNLASTLQVSAPDLARFAIELMDPQHLSQRARDLMLKEAVEVNDRVSWAHGIGIDRSDGTTTYWHWGSNPGYQSLFVIEPKSGKGIVILTNTGGFLDFFSRRKGGYTMSKAVARDLLEIDGAWDVRGYR